MPAPAIALAAPAIAQYGLLLLGSAGIISLTQADKLRNLFGTDSPSWEQLEANKAEFDKALSDVSNKEFADKVETFEAKELGWLENVRATTPEEKAALQPYLDKGIYTENANGTYSLNPEAALTASRDLRLVEQADARAYTPNVTGELSTLPPVADPGTVRQTQPLPTNIFDRGAAPTNIAPTAQTAPAQTAPGSRQFEAGPANIFDRGAAPTNVAPTAQTSAPTQAAPGVRQSQPLPQNIFDRGAAPANVAPTAQTAAPTQAAPGVRQSQPLPQNIFDRGAAPAATAGVLTTGPAGQQGATGTRQFGPVVTDSATQLPDVLTSGDTAGATAIPHTGESKANFGAIIAALNGAQTSAQLNEIVASAGAGWDDPGVQAAYNAALARIADGGAQAEVQTGNDFAQWLEGKKLRDAALANQSPTPGPNPQGGLPVYPSTEGGGNMNNQNGASTWVNPDLQQQQTDPNLHQGLPTSQPATNIPNIPNVLGGIADNVRGALGAGQPKDAIAQRLIDAAAQTRDQYGRQALFELGSALISGSNDNISRMLSKMTPGSGQVGADVVDPLGAAVESSGRLNLQGQDQAKAYDDQLAAHQEQKAAQGLQMQGILNQSDMSTIKFTDDGGQSTSLADLRKEDPSLYSEIQGLLTSGNSAEIQAFINESGMTGLPPQFYGLEAAAPVEPDWSDPRVKDAAQVATLKRGLSENELAAIGNDSYDVINNYMTKGLVPNPNFGIHGDDRKYVNLKAPSEGAGRNAANVNQFLGGNVLRGGLTEVFDGHGGLDRLATIKKQLPWADEQQINSAMALFNMYQASDITGLAGVETLTEYLEDRGAAPSFFANETAYKNWMADGLEKLANTAYNHAGRNSPLTAETMYIKQHGGKAFMSNVLDRDVDGEVFIYEGKYWIDLGNENFELLGDVNG